MNDINHNPGATMKDTATISRDKKFRYHLSRVNLDELDGDEESTTVLFIMCNPSTADAKENDPTITRYIDFATQ